MAVDRTLGPDPESDPLARMPRRELDFGALQGRLGYVFSDRALLDHALRHVSAAGGDPGRSNQRLEFLGDRVLGLAVSELLYAAFPNATEGELSHRLSGLVRRETCSAIAAGWELAPFLALGSGEGKAGGRRNQAILADATEAVIGAVFLDGGYEAARALVERALADQVRSPDRPARDPKTALQEWAQGAGRPTPTYAVAERSGPDHAPRFRVAASIPGLDEAFGQGGSRRAAEQEAALALLRREGVWRESDHGA